MNLSQQSLRWQSIDNLYQVGDPLETAAISSVFGNRGTYLGSVCVSTMHGYMNVNLEIPRY